MMPFSLRNSALKKLIKMRSHKDFLVLTTDHPLMSARMDILEKWLRHPSRHAPFKKLINPYMIYLNDIFRDHLNK